MNIRSGVLAEFRSAEAMLAGLAHLRGQGYTRLDTYTPYPIHGLDDALGLRPSKVPLAVLVAGLSGAALAYLIQWYMNAYDYPINVGGRPPHSWPAFIFITFETAVLFAGFTALFSALAFSGLPRLWDPVFEVEGFERASIDRFWIAVERDDPKFDVARIEEDLLKLEALRVVAVGSVR